MTLLLCVLFTLAICVYVFFPEGKVAAQRDKTRLEFLDERRAAILDNLRDLQFEREAGKYQNAEYETERAALEAEEAAATAEAQSLSGPRGARGSRT